MHIDIQGCKSQDVMLSVNGAIRPETMTQAAAMRKHFVEQIYPHEGRCVVH